MLGRSQSNFWQVKRVYTKKRKALKKKQEMSDVFIPNGVSTGQP